LHKQTRLVTLRDVETGSLARSSDWAGCLAWNVRQYQGLKLYLPHTFRLVVAWQLAFCLLLTLPLGQCAGLAIERGFVPALVYLGGMSALNFAVLGPRATAGVT